MHCDTDWWGVRSRQPTRRGAGPAHFWHVSLLSLSLERGIPNSGGSLYAYFTVYAIELRH
eukprot:scaffold104937_cov75-Phaeocystis_antarctica.AAC.6